MKYKNRRLCAIAVVGIASMFATSCGTGGGGAEEESLGASVADMEPVTLKVSDVNPETAGIAIALTEWMEYVTEATDGKVKFEPYWSGTLHEGAESLSALQSGLTDISFFYPGFYGEKLPVAHWVTEHFASHANVGFPQTLLASSPAIQALYETSSEITNELAEYNATPLVLMGSGSGELLCTSPVDSLQNAQNTTVNTSGSPWSEEVSALGMGAEAIELSEEFGALQRGVIDCVTGTVSPLMTRGAWEVAKYYNPANLSPSLPVGYMIRKDLWESLPLEVQQIMHDGEQIVIEEFSRTQSERYAEFAEQASDMEIEFLDPTEFNSVLSAYVKENTSTLLEEAPASVEDPEAMLQQFDADIEAWLGILEQDLGIPVVEETPENLDSLYRSMRDLPWSEYEDAVQEALVQYRPE